MNSITLSSKEYQDLIDARDHAIAMRDVANGTPLLTANEVEAFINTSTPLAFWRKYRGLSQTKLAEQLSISQAYLAQIEIGKRVGDVRLYAKLASALGLRIEGLLAE